MEVILSLADVFPGKANLLNKNSRTKNKKEDEKNLFKKKIEPFTEVIFFRIKHICGKFMSLLFIYLFTVALKILSCS